MVRPPLVNCSLLAFVEIPHPAFSRILSQIFGQTSVGNLIKLQRLFGKVKASQEVVAELKAKIESKL